MADDNPARPTTVSVKILDKEYQVSCPEDEIDALTSSARYLDQQMRQIRESGKVIGSDRIAVMAALNIAHEMLTNRSTLADVQGDLHGRIDGLTKRLSLALAEQKQLKL